MKNITVSVDEETHRLVRMRAAELDTSVSALVRDVLKDIVGGPTREDMAGTGHEPADEFEQRQQRMNEVIQDIHTTRPEFRAADNLPREKLYHRASVGVEAAAQQDRD